MQLFLYRNTFYFIGSYLSNKVFKNLQFLRLIIKLYIFFLIFISKHKQFHNNDLYHYNSLNHHDIISEFKKNNLYYNSSIEKNIKKRYFFFMDKFGKLKFCKNFGIFIYNYPFMETNNLYGNIGDYIQSLAALQYLPKNCIPLFVDRDKIEFFNNSKYNITVIMNSWNIIEKGNRKISDKIEPIYISYHINNIDDIDSFSIKQSKLKKENYSYFKIIII